MPGLWQLQIFKLVFHRHFQNRHGRLIDERQLLWPFFQLEQVQHADFVFGLTCLLETAVCDRFAVGPELLPALAAKAAKVSSIARDVSEFMAEIGLAKPSVATGQTVDDVLHWDRDMATVTVDDVKAAAAKVLDLRASVTGVLLPEPGQ